MISNCDLCIDKDLSIKDAIKTLDKTAKKILLVVENDKLVGVVTDGDIRRWILKNGSLTDSISEAMNKSPHYLYKNNKEKAKKLLIEKKIDAIPILNSDHTIFDIYFFNESLHDGIWKNKTINNKVVVMAGGKGTRLEPYTKILPKPLIPIGDVTILERIISYFESCGCSDFYLTINHKKNMIKAYFGEIEKKYNLHYVEELEPLGTAGSLSLLDNHDFKDSFFVSNCDILIKGDYYDMMEYHKKNNNKITIITSLKTFKIPYGIVQIADNGIVSNMEEKPEYNLLVNTGFYILEPECLEYIPANRFFLMTDLIDYCLKKEKKVGTYPVSENSWLDMGQINEMNNMLKQLEI